MSRSSGRGANGACQWLLLRAACVWAVLILPAHLATAQEPPPAKVYLSGWVHDFADDHPDFQATPSQGTGVYAGLLAPSLDGANAPTFIGSGRRIISHARDASSRNIAPHLAQGGFGQADGTFRILLAVRNAAAMTSDDAARKSALEGWGHIVTVIDDEASQSQFNAGCAVNDVVYVSDEVDAAHLGTKLREAVIGVVTEDEDLSDSEFGFSAGEDTYDDNSITITNNTHYITQGFSLGTLVLTTESWNFSRAEGSIATGAVTLADGDDDDGDDDPALLVIETGAQRYGLGPAPARRVRLPWCNGASNFSTLNANGLTIMRRAVGWAASNNPGACTGSAAGDAPAALHPTPSTGGVTSSSTFADWFVDAAGVNLSALSYLTLTRQADGTYLFDDTTDPFYGPRGGFFPIDDMLFGNSVGAGFPEHNHHFTYAVEATFTHDGSANQFFTVASDSDVWVFIDTKLAIDLGGVHGPADQRIDLDRLCLNDDQSYVLRLFVADRFAPGSSLRIETNIVFEGATLPTITAGFD